jgi:hypothetical protein
MGAGLNICSYDVAAQIETVRAINESYVVIVVCGYRGEGVAK